MNIDHIVLWVDSPKNSLDFFVEVVGLRPVRAQEYADGAAPFPSVRVNDTTRGEISPGSLRNLTAFCSSRLTTSWLHDNSGPVSVPQPGTFVLIPQVVNAVKVPVIAAGGIAGGRGIAAAFFIVSGPLWAASATIFW